MYVTLEYFLFSYMNKMTVRQTELDTTGIEQPHIFLPLSATSYVPMVLFNEIQEDFVHIVKLI